MSFATTYETANRLSPFATLVSDVHVARAGGENRFKTLLCAPLGTREAGESKLEKGEKAPRRP